MRASARNSLIASAALALAIPGAASAQYGQPTPQPPQSMPGHGQEEHRGSQAAPASAALAAANDVIAAAACMVGHNQAAGDALLATVPYSAAERAQAVRLLGEMRRCTHGPQIVSTPEVIRGAFAEAGVETVFATPPAARSPALAASPLTRPTEVEAAYLAAISPMYQLADCATPREPALARAVLATAPGSAEEGTAVAALYPTFQACVAPGSSLRIDHRIMRRLFAEALYRWSLVQRDGPASPFAAAPATTQVSPAPTPAATNGASH